ncbi:MAG TPA: hypothetical protein VGW32_00330 [Pyrinomonadaceae bacterium]|nr:hypothetical protein [Pyrinomonadaceae bacterium]
MVRSIIAVVVSYITMFVLNFLGFVGLYAVVGPGNAFKPRSFLASNRWIAMAFAIVLVSGIIAGLLCAAIARGRKATLALAVIILAVGLMLAIPAVMKSRANAGMVRVGDVPAMEAAEKAYWPVWAPFTFPFVSAIGALIGGKLKRRK